MARIQWNSAAANKLQAMAEQQLVKIGFRIEADIKRGFGPGTGRVYMKGKNKNIVHVASAPGEPPAVDTGRLRASISTNWSGSGMSSGKVDSQASSEDGVLNPGSDLNVFKVVVGTRVQYACVFDGKTQIQTKTDTKGIKNIVPGDLVLTQTGEFKPVVAIFKRPALEVPNMVTLKVEWRADKKTHKLTITEDHKLLVFREGRNKWVRAGDLEITDLLFSKKKVIHNKGISKYGVKFCLHCKKKIEINSNYGGSRKFCNVQCRADYWKENNCNPHIGMKRSVEVCQKMSKTRKKNLQDHPEQHINHILSKKGYITNEEKMVFNWLKERNFQDIIRQFPVAGCFTDFYIPEINTIYEVDGAYWHQNQKKEIERDLKILKVMPDVNIVHMHFYSERHTPKNIDPNPLPNVIYSVCNPDVNSFVDLSVFETKKIIGIKKWVYGAENPKDKRARWHATVYDLAIEDIHSYYANGCLVSNSWLEFGTSRMAARPFMRPIVEKFRSIVNRLGGSIK